MNIKSPIIWDIMLFSLQKVSRYVSATSHLHLQAEEYAKQETSSIQTASDASACFVLVSCLAYS
jgi:hypothetical protein